MFASDIAVSKKLYFFILDTKTFIEFSFTIVKPPKIDGNMFALNLASRYNTDENK